MNNQNKEAETIICRSCWTEHQITESVLCKCGQMIYTSPDAREKIKELDALAHTAHIQSLRLTAELAFRERRRFNNDEKGNHLDKNFWTNVRNTPYWAKPPKEKVRTIQALDLTDFV